MKETRKNASAVSMTADTIYVFGGSSNTQGALDTIEQYSVSCNRWTLLSVQLPRALCFMTTFKVSSTEIMILGGSTREKPNNENDAAKTGKTFMSS